MTALLSRAPNDRNVAFKMQRITSRANRRTKTHNRLIPGHQVNNRPQHVICHQSTNHGHSNTAVRPAHQHPLTRHSLHTKLRHEQRLHTNANMCAIHKCKHVCKAWCKILQHAAEQVTPYSAGSFPSQTEFTASMLTKLHTKFSFLPAQDVAAAATQLPCK